jgi:murein DD-endopeptidase MepM/ murein hydrolase activator NlpD
MKHFVHIRVHLLAGILVLLTTSCRAAPLATQETLSEAAAQPAPAQTGTAAAVEIQPENNPGPNHGDPPLRFTFPEPRPAPESLWRPPLYDVPWALGPHDHFFFARPIAADEVNWPLADYRYGGIFFSSDIVHTGVDIPAPKGTPVIAAGSGRVIWAGYGLYSGTDDPDDPYGLAVTIRHDFGWQGQRLITVYAHMDKIDVVNGQNVETGDVLGHVGTTGKTTGPHLHFEVRLERNSYYATLNPELWLGPPQGWGVLVGQLRNTNYSFLTEQDVVVRNKQTNQVWTVRSYGPSAVNSDPYYRENLVLSDLPAGSYAITIDYLEKRYTRDVEIQPGAITYFTFRGEYGYRLDLPSEPDVEELLPVFNP